MLLRRCRQAKMHASNFWGRLQQRHSQCLLFAQVCEKAASEGRASEALLLEWPRLALRFGRVKKALEAAARACQSCPGSAALWQQRLLLQAQQASAQVYSLDCVVHVPSHLRKYKRFLTCSGESL